MKIKSPSSRRAWIEIKNKYKLIGVSIASPSSRRAWIEISKLQEILRIYGVALLAEGVD